MTPLVHLFEKFGGGEFGYWKTNNIKLCFKDFSGAQSYQSGLITLFNILYKYPNKRSKSLEEWVALAEEYFNGIDQGYISGNHLIQPLRGLRRGKKAEDIIAWLRRVWFSQQNQKIKVFNFQSMVLKVKL